MNVMTKIRAFFFLLKFGYNPDKRTGLHQQIVYYLKKQNNLSLPVDISSSAKARMT